MTFFSPPSLAEMISFWAINCVCCESYRSDDIIYVTLWKSVCLCVWGGVHQTWIHESLCPLYICPQGLNSRLYGLSFRSTTVAQRLGERRFYLYLTKNQQPSLCLCTAVVPLCVYSLHIRSNQSFFNLYSSVYHKSQIYLSGLYNLYSLRHPQRSSSPLSMYRK